MKPLKVLVIEDREEDAELLLLHLKRAGYDVYHDRVQTADAMRNALAEKHWEIVISDYQMPSFSGLDAVEILKSSGLDIPFILISGTIGEETAVKAMLAGVNDYLMKDRLARLVPAIERELNEAENRRAKHEAEIALRKSEGRYRELFENANDTIFTVDMEGFYTSVSKKVLELTGYPREEILLTNFTDLLSPDDALKVREMMEKKLSGKTNTTRYEITIKAKGDIQKIVEVSSRVVYDNGNPVGFQGIARDVSARKKLEDDLRQSEKRLQLALTAARMGVWEWNLKTDDLLLSPECLEVIMISDPIRKISDYRKIVHSDDTAFVFNKVAKSIEQKTILNADYRIISSEGELIWISNSGITEYDQDGTPAKLIGVVSDVTERKNLESNLQASEMRFRALAENNVAGVTLCESDGTLNYVNDAYLKIIGYSREDFENGQLRWNEITAPEFHEADAHSLNEARENGASEVYEKAFIRKDGSKVPVMLANALSAIGGKEHFISAILDITERQRAERELRESEENFRALIQATTQHVWMVSGSDKNSEFEKVWFELTGQTNKESEGLGWLKVLHPDDREATHIAWLRAYENYTLFDSVYRVWTVNKEYRYFAARGIPVFDQAGNFRQWIGTFTDITDRKRVEENLRESEARLQLSQQAARVSTWEWNLETKAGIWSDDMWSLLDIEPDKIPKDYETWKRFVHPDDLNLLENALKEVIEGGDPLDIEYRVTKRNGQIMWIAAKGSVVRDSENRAARLLGVNIDITDRKKTEDDLHKSEEKLRQAQKLESIGRLAGGIAHDFNNMLTAINGYSDLTLRRLKPDDPIRRNIEEIKEAGERSAALTHQLLAFSRRQILQPKIVNVNEIVSKTTGLLQRLIGEDIQIISTLSSDIGQVKAEPGQISQVIMNLAVNSRDAMPQGGVISIETKNVYLNEEFVRKNREIKIGNYVLLAVSDTGTGIEKESLELIFEPFYTTKEVGKGTGLGLATVYGIVNQSGGYINVDSTIGTGTTFEIYLPRVDERVEPAKKNIFDEKWLHGTETILLVEDEPIVRRLTCEILESYGYKIIEAENGEEAFGICKNSINKIDLLLTDIVMPKMGGYELIRKLREMNPNLRVLFTSGYTENKEINLDLIASENNFIQKPYSPEAIAHKVREILKAD